MLFCDSSSPSSYYSEADFDDVNCELKCPLTRTVWEKTPGALLHVQL